MVNLGVITLGTALAAMIISGSMALKESFRELEGALLVVGVIIILALLFTTTMGSIYALKEINS